MTETEYKFGIYTSVRSNTLHQSSGCISRGYSLGELSKSNGYKKSGRLVDWADIEKVLVPTELLE